MLWEPCRVCGEETANYCAFCARVGSDGVKLNARFYCDLDCRNKDDLEHMKAHKAFNEDLPATMDRATKAGQIVQSLYYTFRENTWNYDMKQVRIQRDQEGDLVDIRVTDGAGVLNAPGSQTDCKRCGGGWLIEFPAKTFDSYGDDAKHALLVDNSSTWAFVVMHTAVQALFRDLVNDVQSDIKEIVHYPTENASRFVHASGAFGSETSRHDTLYPDEDEQGYTKSVYEIILKCGTKIALDLAGAQWDIQDGGGPHKPVTYWENYSSRWMTGLKYRIPFRSHALKHATKMSEYRMLTSQTLIAEMTFCFNVFMSSSWKDELGFEAREMVEMEFETFHKSYRLLIRTATEVLQKRPKDLDNGKFKNAPGGFDYRHPSVVASTATMGHKRSLPVDIGDLQRFDWKTLSRLIQQPGSEVSLQEKRAAKALQKYRSVYKEPGSWQLFFLEDTLPGPKIDESYVSENPAWSLG
ncbi:hypothetical protein E8E13_001112 [Curvularia kusanoi]|uniref:Suppressor of anucleate metulae protein B n=1 Tax=Curvularia kusanoi TaxID=90978 RepID=A0A9P4T605_CURKU|nr:hypothetical protein E8E13_001112 [Curvularia kusanoi]